MENTPELTQRVRHIGMNYTGAVCEIVTKTIVKVKVDQPLNQQPLPNIIVAHVTNLVPIEDDENGTVVPKGPSLFDLSVKDSTATLGDFMNTFYEEHNHDIQNDLFPLEQEPDEDDEKLIEDYVAALRTFTPSPLIDPSHGPELVGLVDQLDDVSFIGQRKQFTSEEQAILQRHADNLLKIRGLLAIPHEGADLDIDKAEFPFQSTYSQNDYALVGMGQPHLREEYVFHAAMMVNELQRNVPQADVYIVAEGNVMHELAALLAEHIPNHSRVELITPAEAEVLEENNRRKNRSILTSGMGITGSTLTQAILQEQQTMKIKARECEPVTALTSLVEHNYPSPIFTPKHQRVRGSHRRQY